MVPVFVKIFFLILSNKWPWGILLTVNFTYSKSRKAEHKGDRKLINVVGEPPVELHLGRQEKLNPKEWTGSYLIMAKAEKWNNNA